MSTEEKNTGIVLPVQSSLTSVASPVNFAALLRIPVKLNESNWSQWSMFVETALQSVKMTSHLTKDPPVPVNEDWLADDSVIRMALWNAMEPNILQTAMNCASTKQLWTHLQTSYSGTTSLSYAYSVTQSYSRCEQGESSLTEYFSRFKKVYDELRQLFPHSPDPSVDQERQEKIAVLTFIGGLSAQFTSVRPVLLSHSAVSSLSATYHLLKEMFPKEVQPPSSVSVPHSDNSALVASGQRPWFGKGKGGDGQNLKSSSSGQHTDKRCHYCKRLGHVKWNCPHRPKEGQQSQVEVRHPPRTQIASLSAEQLQLLQDILSTQMEPTPTTSLAHSGTTDDPIDWHCT